ncbi:MAG: hypothetical protein M3Y27_21185 [Acidobacteriota bacterium]|nr:hypothetical protein [Acidobacteriota bacterium]
MAYRSSAANHGINVRMIRVRLLLTFALCGALHSQQQDFDPKVYLTTDMFNGRWWQRMNLTTRFVYMAGLKNGLQIIMMEPSLSRIPAVTKFVHNYHPQKFDPQEIIDEIDKVYNERENIRIPVLMVYDFVNDKLKGNITKDQVEERLKTMRKIAADY